MKNILIQKEFEIINAIFRGKNFGKIAIDNSLSSKMFTSKEAIKIFIEIEEAIKNNETISYANKRFLKLEELQEIINYTNEILTIENIFLGEIELLIENYKAREKLKIVENTQDINEIIFKLQELDKLNTLVDSFEIQEVIDTIKEKEDENIETGFNFFDCNNVLARKRFIVIGARASMGKSAVSQILAMRIAKNNKKVMFYSLEMSKREMGKRAFAMETGKMFDEIEDENEVAIRYCDINFERLKTIRFAELLNSKFATLRRQVIKEINTRGLDVVVIDYLQLLQADFGHTELEKLTYITRNLKQMAMDLNICIITPAQLNREAEDKERKDDEDNIKPLSISYLRGSGTIEQDADCVLMLNGVRGKPKIKIEIAKNRHGKNGITQEFYFSGANMQMNEIKK